MKNNCLYCYQALTNEVDFHQKCVLKFFGTNQAPAMLHTNNEMYVLAKQVIERSVAVPGVQPKLSMSILKEKGLGVQGRLTVVGALEGNYIFKPPSDTYPEMPENEHVTMRIAEAFNNAIKNGEIGPVILGRDHHDVSGTDSPYRETSNIYDGSQFTADMAIHNVIGDSFRGATWVSIHNGGGVGWGEVINGGFGMVLDGSKEASKRLQSMLFWDVNNGISRRSWARNQGAVFAIKRAMEAEPLLKVTLPNSVDDSLLN